MMLGGVLVLGLFAAGCASQTHVAKQNKARLDRRIDSLRTVNDALRGKVATLQDSLTFYDEIFSGQYYRDRRRLLNQIDRLRYYKMVNRDGGKTVRTLQAGELFESASAVLTEAGKQQVGALAQLLKEQYPGRTFRVEGHTDSVPVGPGLQEKYPSNWELSAARAAAVLRHLTGEHGMDPSRFSVVGFGPMKPQASNDTLAGRRQNRRVRVTALPRREGEP